MGKVLVQTSTATKTIKDKAKKASEQKVSFASRRSHTSIVGAAAVILIYFRGGN